MTSPQLKNRQWVLSQLKKSAPEHARTPQEAFISAKQNFDLQLEIQSQAELAAGTALEHAFDFMEQAFQTSQEMVIFVTDLTVSTESAAFLAEHPCERYTKYNEQLLVGTRRAQLLSELHRDEEQFL